MRHPAFLKENHLAEGPDYTHGGVRKVSTRVLVLGATVVVLVLAETLYIGHSTAPLPGTVPLGPHKRAVDSTFTFTLPHAHTSRRAIHPPQRPVVGMIEAAQS